MKDTILIGVLLAFNGATCAISYLIGSKTGRQQGYLLARASRVRLKAQAQ